MSPELRELAEVERIAQKLRTLREQYGLSLRDVADRTGLSAAYLSQLEHGKAIPSLKVLQQLGDSFGKSISYFFENARSEDSILFFPRAAQIELESQNGLRNIRILAPGERLEINPVLVTLEPGNGAEADPSTHEGWEFVYLIQGHVRLQVGDSVLECRSGDSACFKSTIPHMAENLGQEKAIGLWVQFRR